MIKTFPKSRVCVIDGYPSIEKGLKTAFKFANHYNISLSAIDGKKLIYRFCSTQLETDYKAVQSPYNKIMFMSKNVPSKKISNFINKYFDSLIKNTALPYCGRHNSESPDLEAAAKSCMNKHDAFKRQRFEQLLKISKFVS